MEKKTGFNKEWILPIIALLFLVVCIVVVKPWKRTERKMIENSIRGSEFNAISFKDSAKKTEWIIDTICNDGKYYVIIGHSLENKNLGIKLIDIIKPTYKQNDTITKF